MRLLLTSNGLGSRRIKKEFLRLLDKPVIENKVLIMTSKKRHSHLKKSIEELVSLGIKRKNIKIVNLSEIRKAPDISRFDIFYSYGGNTFYILDRVRKTGFDKAIKKHVKKNKLYIGLSAGSILVHKTIEISGTGKWADLNTIKLKNLKGLNFTNIAIYPHYRRIMKKTVDDFKKKVNYPVIAIQDKQAVLILGKKVKMIR